MNDKIPKYNVNTAEEDQYDFEYYYHPDHGLLSKTFSREKFEEIFSLISKKKDFTTINQNIQFHKCMKEEGYSDHLISRRMKEGWSDFVGDGTENFYNNEETNIKTVTQVKNETNIAQTDIWKERFLSLLETDVLTDKEIPIRTYTLILENVVLKDIPLLTPKKLSGEKQISIVAAYIKNGLDIRNLSEETIQKIRDKCSAEVVRFVSREFSDIKQE